MRYLKILIIIPISMFIFLINGSFSPNREREDAIRLYNDLYRSSEVEEINWNGSIRKCDPGTLSDNVLDKAENRINYFRQACGLNPITLNESYNEMSQEAVLIMTANGQLNHTPPKNWKCYSDNGFQGAKNSNLGISDFTNFPEIAFITGFILDYGEVNKTCGHRKWLINSRSSEMGYGNTGAYEAVYVSGIQQDPVESVPDYIAYPPSGYFPYNLIFEKWSFGIPYGKDVDFGKVKVEMYDGKGKKLPVRILSKTDPWYFDPTVVWQAESLFTKEEIKYLKNTLLEKGFVGQEITVKINNVTIDGEQKDFEYNVIPLDPEK